jgi:serine/threonine protein kinase
MRMCAPQDTIIKELGKGTFGSVFKCKDSKHNDHVALKIIRSIDRYIESAKIESEILDDIFDKQNAHKANLCVKMYSRFRYGGTLPVVVDFFCPEVNSHCCLRWHALM